MDEHDVDLLRSRAKFLGALAALLSGVVWLRYYQLQILQGTAHAREANRNRVEKVRLPASRGIVMDRHGVALADNRPSHSLWLNADIRRSKREELVKRLATTIGRDPEVVWKRFSETKWKVYRDRQFRLFDDISQREFAIFEAKKYAFQGIRLIEDKRRHYPFGAMLVHVLGTMGEVSKEELESGRFDGTSVQRGDYIGKAGLERTYNRSLIGEDGYKYVEEDSEGRQFDVLTDWKREAPVPGKTLRLTIDARLQQIVEEVFVAEKGAVVAIDPDTFEIRACMSRPDFDPNLFAGRMTRQEYQAIIKHPHKPLINRVAHAQYPPGSIFKVATLAAGMASGVVGERSASSCPGHFWFSGRAYHCWKKGGHGRVSPTGSIKHSCNVFFYRYGHEMGIDAITSMGSLMGFGAPTGVELDGERAGINPGKEWKREARDEPWWPGETLSVSIGQGFTLVTPMQLVQFMGIIANRGTFYRPTLVDAVVSPGGIEQSFSMEDRFIRQVELPPWQWTIIHEGMRLVVEGGTARRARVKGLSILGKTGTAQVAGSKHVELKADEDPPPHLRDHNWFASICEAPNGERLCMIVFIENGGKAGGKQRLEFTRDIYQRYFASQLEIPEAEESVPAE